MASCIICNMYCLFFRAFIYRIKYPLPNLTSFGCLWWLHAWCEPANHINGNWLLPVYVLQLQEKYTIYLIINKFLYNAGKVYACYTLNQYSQFSGTCQYLNWTAAISQVAFSVVNGNICNLITDSQKIPCKGLVTRVVQVLSWVGIGNTKTWSNGDSINWHISVSPGIMNPGMLYTSNKMWTLHNCSWVSQT